MKTKNLDNILENQPFDRHESGPNKGRVIWDETNSFKVAEYLLEKIGYTLSLSINKRVEIVKRICNQDGGAQKFLYNLGKDECVNLESFMNRNKKRLAYAPLEKTGSAYAFFKWFDPELFDHDRKDTHLHEWDFSTNYYWDVEADARYATDHILYEMLNYETEMKTDEKANILIEKIFNYKGDKSNGPKAFFIDSGLISILKNKRTYLKDYSYITFFEWYLDPPTFNLFLNGYNKYQSKIQSQRASKRWEK